MEIISSKREQKLIKSKIEKQQRKSMKQSVCSLEISIKLTNLARPTKKKQRRHELKILGMTPDITTDSAGIKE